MSPFEREMRALYAASQLVLIISTIYAVLFGQWLLCAAVVAVAIANLIREWLAGLPQI